MGHVDRGNAQPFLQIADFRAHLHPQLGIQIGQWLIEQKHLGIAHDGASRRHPLTLAAGQFLGIALQVIREPQRVSGLPHQPADLGLG